MAIKQSEYRSMVELLSAAKVKIDELEKKLASETNTKNYYSDLNNKSTAEIEQVHQILDSLNSPPPRRTKHEESWRQVDLTLTARLASWLASR